MHQQPFEHVLGRDRAELRGHDGIAARILAEICAAFSAAPMTKSPLNASLSEVGA